MDMTSPSPPTTTTLVPTIGNAREEAKRSRFRENHHSQTTSRSLRRRHAGVSQDSPVGIVDPAVRAMNTLLFGLLVHFGTLRIIAVGDSITSACGGGVDDALNSLVPTSTTTTISSGGRVSDWLLTALLLHEYWVYLQHCNVLANPLCQRLDRQYGIALLKSNQHWAIAGTLAAYWCRETLGMFLCLPFLQNTGHPSLSLSSSSLTQYMILYSLVYHTIKSRGVRQDALRRHSSSFGIMRVVIDKFYWHNTFETVLTIGRLFLQGLDTWIHFAIIRDLLYHGSESYSLSSSSPFIPTTRMMVLLHALFVVWVVHAALNQYFRRSTASVMVQAWYSLTAPLQQRHKHHGQTPAAGATANDAASPCVNENHDAIKKEKKKTHVPLLLHGCGGADDENDNDECCGDDDDEENDNDECCGDDETQEESISSTETDDSLKDAAAEPDDFIVRRLLRPGRVPTEFKGRQGAATDAVDTAIRIETVLSILSATFLLGLGTAPFRVLSSSSLDDIFARNLGSKLYFLFSEGLSLASLSLAWWLSSLLYGIWSLFLKTKVRDSGSEGPTFSSRTWIRAMINIVDLVALIATATFVFQPESIITPTGDESGMICWYLAIGVTIKSYVQASGIPRAQLFWASMKVFEFLGKLILSRKISLLVVGGAAAAAVGAEKTFSSDHLHDEQLAWFEATLSLAWAIWVVSTPIPTPCENASQMIGDKDASIVADVVFLGHPAELIDCWALWLLPYGLTERWQGPIWAIPLWPIHYIVGWYVCNYRRKLFGDEASFFCCDDVEHDGIRMQTWTASHFGRHFVTNPLQVKQNIEAAARYAERIGVKVLCLGALNKAECINAGGTGVVKALGPHASLSVIHGNHLTAAAVVATAAQCFGEKAKVFLTGASSKVGWAVAQALRDRHGFEVLCHSSDPKRREIFQEQGFKAASKLPEGTRFSKLWIVGKYDLAVPDLIPQNATAVVFSVPHTLGSRADVRVIEAGTLHMDLSRLDRPRQFTNKLREHEIFACHAASAVAAYRLKRDGNSRILEIGPVDPNTMDTWLDDAKMIGFHVPKVTPILSAVQTNCRPSGQPASPVIIIGAGPSGLAVAASLIRRNIPTVILESQEDPSQFGSWEHHFSGLEVTSQKKWCQLPGFSMISSEDEWNGEYITAQDYRRYLQLYAARFGIVIRRGVQVISIEKGHDPQNPWTVRICRSSSLVQTQDRSLSETEVLFSSAVVIATGKHRIARRNTSDDLAGRLKQAKIPFCHTVDLKDESTWSQAIQAAQEGRLAIVGFGNSAADIATAILQKCPWTENGNATPSIHIAARTIPPVFPRKASVLRVDTIGWWVRRLPTSFLEDFIIRLLWWGIPSSRICNAAFPSHLPRWRRIQGRVPVIDKYGTIAAAFQCGRLVGHGPVLEVFSTVSVDQEGNELSASPSQSRGGGALTFDDSPQTKQHDTRIPVDMVLLATGYQTDDSSLNVTREDRLNGLYRCGFGNDRLLPLQSIGEQAQSIAFQIASEYN